MSESRHLVLVPHTHWDREWHRTHEQFRHQLVALIDRVLDTLEADPAYRHFTLDGQAIVLDDYLEVRPEARERIAKLVGAGRLLVGPWYVLPDEWLVSGEALIRNLRTGLTRAEAIGGAMRLGYVPDQFGHVGQLPQIFAGMGFDAAALWRGVGADVGETLFDWEAPDGSRLLTVYLPRGYGNAAHLPADLDALVARLASEIEGLGRRSRIPTLLMMNGTDHAMPDPGMPAAVEAALTHLPGVTAEVGTLPGFVARARDEAPAERPLHRGELRSGLRSPLLPGCASARTPQKQSDFENDRLLVRYLEPLASWLGAITGRVDRAWLDLAWRVALENHPHDSICGCSIDAVHDQMEARFARVREIAGAELERVWTGLSRRIRPPSAESGADGPALAAFLPGAGGVTPLGVEIEVDESADAQLGAASAWHVRDAGGTPLPTRAIRLDGPDDALHLRIPASVSGFFTQSDHVEFFGYHVQDIAWRREGDTLAVDLCLGRSPASINDLAPRRTGLREAVAADGVEWVDFRARVRSRWRLEFVDRLPGWGVRVYGASAGAGPSAGDLEASPAADGGARVGNGSWAAELDASGRLRITRRADAGGPGAGRSVDDALRLVSDGDRGDEYNYDPVPGGAVVERPERVEGIEARVEGARSVLRWRAAYRVPIELSADRAARSDATTEIPVAFELSLWTGVDRIDLSLEAENKARDHRWRIHCRAPARARRFAVESAFERVERPIDPPAPAEGERIPAERPIGTTPQRQWACVADDDLALSVSTRGLAEVEAVVDPDGDGLAVTWWRSVGWLSRNDLVLRPQHAGPPFATPGAQVPGVHRAELSLRWHAPDQVEALAEGHRFAYPPFAGPLAPEGAAAEDSATTLEDGDRLIALDDPRLVVSAIEPRADGSIDLRVWNHTDSAVETDLATWAGLAGLGPVDLLGRPAETGAGQSDGASVSLGPAKIATWRVSRAPGAP